jgi:Fur family transcriptional regulator, ferric uptake regulator
LRGRTLRDTIGPVKKRATRAAEVPSADALKTLLKEHGLRITEPRVAVLAALYGRAAAVSHADLTLALAPQGLDRVTVYRTLLTLTDIGLLVRTDLGDHVWRFELASDKGTSHAAHPHFICVQCGSIDCLPKGAVSLRLSGAPKRSVQEVQVKGCCGDCLPA